MTVIIIIIVSLLAVYFFGKYIALWQSVRRADRQLSEITSQIEENRIVKLAVPDRAMEQLLSTVNEALAAIRREHIHYQQRERALQHQIENISHDLRTPLTSILGYMEIIDQSLLSEEDRESMVIVIQKARFLQRLIEQFYDLSRLTADDFRLDIQALDAGQLLRETIIGFYQVLESRGLAVEVRIPEQPMMVMGDRDGMERMFGNFLQNAGRYARTEFHVSAKSDNGRVRMIFENDVDSLIEADVSRLFERFYISDSARSQGNTGLGLTIARQLAQKMGGSLTAQLTQQDGRRYLQIICEMRGAVG